MTSLFAIGFRQQLADEVAKNETLRCELQGARETATTVDSWRELLKTGLKIMFDDLQMVVGPSKPIEQALMRIPDQMQDLAKASLRRGVHKAVSIVYSHYPQLGYAKMGEGCCPGLDKKGIRTAEEQMAQVAECMTATIVAEDTTEEEEEEDDGGNQE